MARYLVHLLAVIAVLFAAAVLINWMADPYAIFGSPVIKGFNESKPVLIKNSRIFKIVGYVHDKMDALILGTSRADFGLSPKHPGFQHQRTINLALPGQPNTESALIFKTVADRNSLKTAVIGLDFFASNALLTNTDDFSMDNFEPDRKLKLLLSFDTLLASKKTLFKSGNPLEKPDEARITKSKPIYRQAFLISDKGYMWGGGYLPNPQCDYQFAADLLDNGKKYRNEPLEAIRSMIALAHQRRIKLYLFISPSHARQWEVIDTVGLWDKWEEWKRRLVQMNHEEATKAGQTPFDLWDFSGYNGVSTEAVPAANQPPAKMFGYIESSHYQPIVGDMLLDRMFGLNSPERPLPDDFGVKISLDTIEKHLENIRSARTIYRQNHPQDIAEIQALADEVKKQNQCIGNKRTKR